MTTAIKKPPSHGSEARYQGTVNRPGCRCRRCINGWTRAGQRRLLARLEGRPASIPAAPITAHIRALHGSGMTTGQIAEAAQTDASTIRAHACATFPNIRRTTADKILAVKPQQYSGYGFVPALVSRRRLQALYAAGHGPQAIAAATEGLSVRTIEYVAYGARKSVSVINHRAIDQAYQALASIHGSTPRALNRAVREGWKDPVWWEDYGRIDDPDFNPDHAEREPGHRELAALRRAEIQHLADSGCTPEEIHKRLGNEVALSTVRAIVAEHRTGQKRDRKQVTA